MVISDLIGSPGFAGDHLGFRYLRRHCDLTSCSRFRWNRRSPPPPVVPATDYCSRSRSRFRWNRRRCSRSRSTGVAALGLDLPASLLSVSIFSRHRRRCSRSSRRLALGISLLSPLLSQISLGTSELLVVSLGISL